MGDYMESLEKLRPRSETVYFPGHGPHITDAPRFVAYYILHRKARENSIPSAPRPAWLCPAEKETRRMIVLALGHGGLQCRDAPLRDERAESECPTHAG